jgi:hypothetical protein
MLSEDILNALEMHSASTEEDCFLSLNAIVGTQNNKVIHLVVLVNNQVISILVDSESSHTFLNEAMLLRLACKVTAVPKMIVKVANGDIVFSDREVKDFHWWIQGHTFKVDAKILDLAAYDLILGMDWLEQHRPMTCDWLLKWIEFDYQGSRVRLQGIVPSVETEVLQEISGEQLHKLAKGHDVWALVAVNEDEKKQEEYLFLVFLLRCSR